MGKKTRHKYGGVTMSSHPYCPARVLLGGRCPSKCPAKLDDHCFDHKGYCKDHVGLEESPSGELRFVLRLYGAGWDKTSDFEKLLDYCAYHGLLISTEEKPWNGMPVVCHIIITKRAAVK